MYKPTREDGSSRAVFWLFYVSTGQEQLQYSIFYGYNSL